MSQHDELKHGDPIWFAQTCRGGYGFSRDVPGEFVRRTTKRVTIRLFRKSGAPVKVAVSDKNIRRRYLKVESAHSDTGSRP